MADISDRDHDPEPKPPVRRRYMLNDTTAEKLGVILQENPNGTTVFRDELTGLLRMLDKPGNETARSFFLECWNGDGNFVFDRIMRGTVDIAACCLSILGGIQPGPLQGYRQQAMKIGAGDDGLMQRFQLLVQPDQSTTWKNVDRWPSKDAKNRAFEVFERLDRMDGFQMGGGVDDYNRDAVPYVRFSREAQPVFDDWRTGLEHRLRAGTDGQALESHLAKYRSLIPSLALLLHLADSGTGAVGRPALERAIRWGRYLESHARRVYGDADRPGMQSTRALARKITDRSVQDSFSARDIYRNEWSQLNDANTVEQAAGELEKLGWLVFRQLETGGRKAGRWFINPRVYELTKPTEPTQGVASDGYGGFVGGVGR